MAPEPLKLSSKMVAIPFEGSPINPTERGPTADFNAPTCPGCGVSLQSVLCDVHEIYAFIPEDGYYNEKPDDIGNDYKCPACKTDLSSVFPDGVVDYAPAEAA